MLRFRSADPLGHLHVTDGGDGRDAAVGQIERDMKTRWRRRTTSSSGEDRSLVLGPSYRSGDTSSTGSDRSDGGFV